MKMTLVRVAALAVVLAPLACSGGGDSATGGGPLNPPPTNTPPATPPPSQGTVDTVRLTGAAFEPENLTIRPGRTVVWVNTQPVFHTVTPDGHSQFSRATSSTVGEVLRVTFNSAGAFAYFCEPHRAAGMTGRITVQP